ncbi:AAA family ATPase, partial [Faecalibaculum rodentium]
MLKRKIDSVLRDWKNDSHKKTALCLIGARQTGKTTAVRMFARQEYSCFLELNFLDNPQARAIFEPEDGVEKILQRISAISQTSLVPGKTLILLDEIQECPQARTAVKFLVEDGR